MMLTRARTLPGRRSRRRCRRKVVWGGHDRRGAQPWPALLGRKFRRGRGV